MLIQVNIKYYDLLTLIINNIGLPKFEIEELRIPELSKLNTYLDEYKENNIIANVIDKIMLHNFNDNIYIRPQDSGSCSWFSIYWPIILYNILRGGYYDIYIKQVKLIVNTCFTIVKKIFTKDNFNKAYKSKSDDFILMKKLCNKFIDIGLLDKNILTNEIDFIYDIKNNIILNEYNIYNASYEKIYNKNNFNDSELQKKIIEHIEHHIKDTEDLDPISSFYIKYYLQ